MPYLSSDLEAARGWGEDDRLVPGARDQRGDVLWLEVEVRRHGRERGTAVEGEGRREQSFSAQRWCSGGYFLRRPRKKSQG